MRGSLVALTLVFGLSTGMIPAGAHTLTVSDPNDTQGKLDIREAALFHKGSGNDLKYIWIIRTYRRWFPRHVDNGKGNFAILIKRSQESSWRIEITKGNNGLRAHLSMCIEAQGCGLGDEQNYNATRPNKKSVRVKVPAEDLEAVGNRMKWLANSAFGTGCSGNCYFDRAPDEGLAKHQLN